MNRIAKTLRIVCLSAGALAAATVSAQYLPLTGGTLTGPLTGPEATFGTINNVISACSQTGSTADVQISNAITALGANGGIVDLSCYSGTTPIIASTVNIPQNVWIRGGGTTANFQPSSTSLNPVFQLNAITSKISGVWVDLTALSSNSWTGCVFGLSGNYQPLSGTSGDPYRPTIEDFVITAGNQNNGGSGICATVTSDTTNSMAGLSIRHGFISGTQYAINIAQSETGWFNANQISDVSIKQQSSGTACGVLFNSTGSAPGGIGLNTFSQMTYEDEGGGSSDYAECFIGSGPIQGNTWEGSMNDNPTPVHYDCSPSCGTGSSYQDNWFSGAFNGTWESGAPPYDSHINLWLRDYNLAALVTVQGLNITNAYGLLYQGNQVIGTDGPTSTAIYPIEHGGVVAAVDPSGGYAPMQASAFDTEGGDFAEDMRADQKKESYEPGDVLVLTADDNSDVRKSAKPYSPMVAGIYATKPGVVGLRDSVSKSPNNVPMAMVGVVPAKVSAENGPIHKGDLLVTSSLRGYAMKGTDRGRMLGAVIGKAMGSLDSGTGVIEVLVTLQ